MHVVVTWKASIRVTALLATALGAWVAHASLLTDASFGPRNGFMGVVCMLGGAYLAGRAWLERIEADAAGLVVRDFRGVRRIPWGDVQEVEAIAEQGSGRERRRWKTTPEKADVLVLHTRRGAVRLTRRQTHAFADFVALLRADRAPAGTYREAPPVPVLEREDANVGRELHGSASTRQAQLREAIHLSREVLIAIPLALLVTLGAAGAALVLTGSGLAAPVGAAVPWTALVVGWRTVRRLRRERFGVEHERPALTPDELVATANALLAAVFLVPLGALLLSGSNAKPWWVAAVVLVPGVGFGVAGILAVHRMLRVR